MAQSSDNAATAGPLWPNAPWFTAPADAVVLRDVARRCSPATHETAGRFRRTGDLSLLPVLLAGLIERYVEPARRGRLGDPADTLRLGEDLGLDSLTQMEFAMFAEDVLGVPINNDELAQLRTLGDIRRFVEARRIGLPRPLVTPAGPADAG